MESGCRQAICLHRFLFGMWHRQENVVPRVVHMQPTGTLDEIGKDRQGGRENGQVLCKLVQSRLRDSMVLIGEIQHKSDRTSCCSPPGTSPRAWEPNQAIGYL